MPPSPVFRRLLRGIWAVLWLLLAEGAAAQGIELAGLKTERREGALVLDFDVRVTLSRGVEDALRRGVPVYFAAQADLLRNRWYWRDERIGRVSRAWRLAFQPLTGSWRVGLVGGLNQSYTSLEDALVALSHAANWRLADLAQLDADSRYYVEFSYRLDTSQLPSPMQIGIGGQAEWALGVEHVQRIEP